MYKFAVEAKMRNVFLKGQTTWNTAYFHIHPINEKQELQAQEYGSNPKEPGFKAFFQAF